MVSGPQIRWTYNGLPLSNFDNQLLAYGGCGINRMVTVGITVSSANGSEADG